MSDPDLSNEDIATVLKAVDLAKFVMSHGVSEGEALAILEAILTTIERVMPAQLVANDSRVLAAQQLRTRLVCRQAIRNPELQ